MNPNHPFFFHIKSSIYPLLFQLIIHWEFGKEFEKLLFITESMFITFIFQ